MAIPSDSGVWTLPMVPDEIVLGVDLGTTNTVAAFCDITRDAEPELVRFGTDVSVRSLLHLGNVSRSSGVVLIGDGAAQKALAERPNFDAVVANAKVELGLPEQRRQLFRRRFAHWFPETFFDPEDAVGLILHHVRERARRQLEEKGPRQRTLRRVVLGIPAHASQHFRHALRRAATIAGFEDSLLVPEPVAAAWMYYRTLEARERRLILIVDIGAGTTDLCLVDVGPGRADVLLTAGDTECGGTAIDYEILRYLREEKNQPDIDASLRNFDNWERVRKLKELVNANPSRKAMMNFAEPLILGSRVTIRDAVQVTVTGQEIFACGDRVAERLNRVLDSLLSEGLQKLPAEIRDRRIDGIMLVGGGCRTRAFLETLEEQINRGTHCERFAIDGGFTVGSAGQSATDTHCIVARGLALLGAAYCGTDDTVRPFVDDAAKPFYYDRVVDSVGLGVVEKDASGREVMEGVLRNNIHISRHSELGSGSGWQRYGISLRWHNELITYVDLSVLAGDGVWSDPPAKVESLGRRVTAYCLGRFSYPLKWPRKGRDVHIAVRYELDANGLIAVYARDMGGDDGETGRTYRPQREDEAIQYSLDYGQLGAEEVVGKQARMADLAVMRELVNDTESRSVSRR